MKFRNYGTENICNGSVGRVVSCESFFISVLSQLLEVLLGLKIFGFNVVKNVLKTLLSSLKRSVPEKASTKIHNKVLAGIAFHVKLRPTAAPVIL